MAVFTQVFNLSDNVKYMNYKIDTTPAGGGNALEFTKRSDRKEFMHRFLEMITTDRDNQQVPTNKTLGWQRIDGADSAGAIFEDTVNVDPLNDSSSAVYGFIRAKTYDYSTTGHWKYIRFKLFERNEDNLIINQTDQTDGARYLSGDRVLVMRYDTYADFGVTAEDSAAVVDSINAGINSAEADGYGSTDLDAGYKRGNVYGTANTHQGWTAAYNSSNRLVNQDLAVADNTGANNTLRWKRSIWSNSVPGYNNYDPNNQSLFYPAYDVIDQNTWTNNTNIGHWPMEIERKGYGLGYNFHPSYYGVNGFGDSDLSVKNSYGELKILLDGNGTMWAFGDQDRTGSNTDSASGTNGFKGVNATGADARYLAVFNTQHQDDNPEKTGPYNTILFAGEYKKEFGEPVSSGYLHNGIKLNAHNFLMNNGLSTPPNFKWRESANWDTAAANREANSGPANQYFAHSFSVNFSTGTNNTVAADDASGYHNSHGIFAQGDNQNTQSAYQTNNNTQTTASGNDLMGHGYQHGMNRSVSMGHADDPEMYWRGRTIGNNVDVNSNTNTYGGSTPHGGANYGQRYNWLGFDGAQFCLTEYPQRTTSTLTGNINTRESIQEYDNYTTPASGRSNLSATRMHMGYLGYVGHLNSTTCYSLNELFFGSRHGLFGDRADMNLGALSSYYPGQPSIPGRMAGMGTSIPLVSDIADSANGNPADTINNEREFVQEFHPISNSQTQYSVYEPILSVGTLKMNGGGIETAQGHSDMNINSNNTTFNISDIGNNNSTGYLIRYGGGYTNSYLTGNMNAGEAGTPGGTAKKRSAFALLGRTYGLKIFGPYRHDKYNFLDAVSVQLDDDGFYAVNPNNAVDHWIVPANTDQVSFLFKK